VAVLVAVAVGRPDGAAAAGGATTGALPPPCGAAGTGVKVAVGTRAAVGDGGDGSWSCWTPPREGVGGVVAGRGVEVNVAVAATKAPLGVGVLV
jgi:hypothetical protein